MFENAFGNCWKLQLRVEHYDLLEVLAANVIQQQQRFQGGNYEMKTSADIWGPNPGSGGIIGAPGALPTPGVIHSGIASGIPSGIPSGISTSYQAHPPPTSYYAYDTFQNPYQPHYEA